jgi:hypothetical protein
MKEQICEQCGIEFEIEAGEDSPVCASCLIALQREKRLSPPETVSDLGTE